jgi:hypothetical protein
MAVSDHPNMATVGSRRRGCHRLLPLLSVAASAAELSPLHRVGQTSRVAVVICDRRLHRPHPPAAARAV